jgi:DNA replication protein DnaC
LSAAQAQGALKTQLKRYLSPALLVLDEVGNLPIDQRGADLLFQVISQRYERGSIVIPRTKPSNNGLLSSTAIAPSPLPSSIAFFTTPKPS